MSGTRITCVDLDTDESDSVVIKDDYCVTTDGDCYVSHTQVQANGTHVVTIKGRRTKL